MPGRAVRASVEEWSVGIRVSGPRSAPRRRRVTTIGCGSNSSAGPPPMSDAIMARIIFGRALAGLLPTPC